jgi:hypothetical protein
MGTGVKIGAGQASGRWESQGISAKPIGGSAD